MTLADALSPEGWRTIRTIVGWSILAFCFWVWMKY